MPVITENLSTRNHNTRIICFTDKYGAERATIVSNEGKLTRDDIIELIQFSKNKRIIDLEHRDISYLDLHGLNFNGCSFRDAYAVGTIFNDSNLASTDFENAHILDASTKGANMEHSNMHNSGIMFSLRRDDYQMSIKRKESEFKDHYFGILKLHIQKDSNGIELIKYVDTTRITRNKIRKILYLSKIRSAIADFSKMDLSITNLNGLDFSNAILNESILTCSDLILSNFNDAYVNNAYFNANICNAAIMNVRGLENARISGLQVDQQNYENIKYLLRKSVNNGKISIGNMDSKLKGIVVLSNDQIRTAVHKYENTLDEDKRYQI